MYVTNVPIFLIQRVLDSHLEYSAQIHSNVVASNYEDIKQDTDRLGIKLATTQGAEYIKLTRDGQAALDFVQQQFENSESEFFI